MAEKKKKKAAAKKPVILSSAPKARSRRTSTKKVAKAKGAAAKATAERRTPTAEFPGLPAGRGGTSLAALRENHGARPKRVRIGRGHGSGMVKTGGEGGKGQTVLSGGGKGPAFEAGQTPWARRLPHRRGYSQKARDIGHFRTTYAVVNLSALAAWDPKVEISPDSLVKKRIIGHKQDGVKILGGTKTGKTLPSGLVFRDVIFSQSARDALVAAGANLGDATEEASA